MSMYDTFCSIFQVRLLEHINSLELENKPELIVLTNDIVQNWSSPTEKIATELLREMGKTIRNDIDAHAMAIELIKTAIRRDILKLESYAKKLDMIQKSIQSEELRTSAEIEFKTSGYIYDGYNKRKEK